MSTHRQDYLRVIHLPLCNYAQRTNFWMRWKDLFSLHMEIQCRCDTPQVAKNLQIRKLTALFKVMGKAFWVRGGWKSCYLIQNMYINPGSAINWHYIPVQITSSPSLPGFTQL